MSRTLHLHSGNILLDPANDTVASSITFFEGYVTAIDQPAPDGVNSVDLKGQTLAPGFIDSHLHLLLGSNGAGDIDLSHCTNRGTFERLLLEGDSHIKDGQWLIASGWSEQTLGSTPNKDWLNCISDTPVMCWRTDFHAAALNQVALDLLDINTISQVVGGKKCKEGIIKETALWEHVCPLIPPPSSKQIRERLLHVADALHADGVTLVGAMEDLQDVEDYLYPMRHELGLRMRIMSLNEPTNKNFARCKVFHDDPVLSVTGFKTFIDGTLGSRTAKMYQPYADDESAGVLVEHALSGTLDQWVQDVTHATYAPVMHAIGDEAVGIALRSIQKIDSELTPRIEHAQFISVEDMQLISGRWFGVQPLHKKDDDSIAPEAVGTPRASTLHNWRGMLDAGAKLSFGSDWPIAPHTPISAIAAAIEQGLTPKEALVATTSDAADSLREPRAGRLVVGSFADATLLDCNPLTLDWQAKTPVVTMTIVEGAIQFQ